MVGVSFCVGWQNERMSNKIITPKSDLSTAAARPRPRARRDLALEMGLVTFFGVGVAVARSGARLRVGSARGRCDRELNHRGAEGMRPLNQCAQCARSVSESVVHKVCNSPGPWVHDRRPGRSLF